MSNPRLLLLAPLALFAALAALFLSRLGAGDPSLLPSAMIGKPVPAFALPPVDGLERGGAPVPGLAVADLESGVFLVNVFASWCVPCRSEMPQLVSLARDRRLRVVGINYKDSDDQARRFLGAFGNPYAAVGADRSGRTGIDWGVYGVPETYLVVDGAIALKHVGPLTEANIRARLMPAIEAALAKAQPATAAP